MNPSSPNPADMLSPQMTASMIRSGGSPGQIFQQNPLAQNQTPGSASYDPALANQPPPGSQATNPMQPQAPQPQQGMQQPNAGDPNQVPQQLSEAQMILNVLSDRLNHHSKITEKTVSTLQKMIEAGLPVPQEQAPTA